MTGATSGRGLPERPATIEDVGRLASVSRQTVSRVLNKKSEVAPETRRRVEQVISELDYRPNLLARSLITRTTHIIGVVVPDISTPFFAEIARGVKETAHTQGYNSLLAHTAEDRSQEVESLRQFRELRVDGVVVVNSRLPDDLLRQALQGLDPVVLTNRELDDAYGQVIWSGYERGSRRVVEHLLAGGHHAIGYLEADPTTTAGRARFAGFGAALAEAGMVADPRLVAYRSPTFRGGYEGAAALLTLNAPPTALFAYNDTMAVGALRACHDLGRRVPQDVAVVGFGGAPVAEWTVPSLTTVPVPLYQIGEAAADALLSMLDGDPPARRIVNVEPALAVRTSSGGRDGPPFQESL